MGDNFDFAAYLSRFLPIVSATVYHGGAAIVGRARSRAHNHTVITRGDRKPIMELTPKARKMMAFTTLATSAEFSSMITLTYGAMFPTSGATVKLHLQRILQWLKRYGIEDLIWFLEFQKRGAPHFHVLTDMIEPNTFDRASLGLAWIKAQGWNISTLYPVFEGWAGAEPRSANKADLEMIDKQMKVLLHEKTWEAVHTDDGARRYAMKHALKPWQKEVPAEYSNVGRWWGCTKSVRDKIRPVAQWDLNEETLRQIATDCNSWVADKPVIPKYILDLRVDIGNEID